MKMELCPSQDIEQIEKERARETIENLSIDIEDCMEIALVWSGEKLATEIEFRSELSEQKDQISPLDNEYISSIQQSMEKLGFVTEMSSWIDEHNSFATDENGDVIFDQITKTEYSTVKTLNVFKDKSAQELFDKIKVLDNMGDDEQYKTYTQILGELYQFPPTAISAFSDDEERVQRWELPNEIRKHDYYHFATFIFSRSNWREEIKTAEKWAQTVKDFSPKIYEEYLKWSKEERLID